MLVKDHTNPVLRQTDEQKRLRVKTRPPRLTTKQRREDCRWPINLHSCRLNCFDYIEIKLLLLKSDVRVVLAFFVDIMIKIVNGFSALAQTSISIKTDVLSMDVI